jgi:hypothetical protein
MNEFSCIVKPYMLATTSSEVSAEASHFFFQKGAMRLDRLGLWPVTLQSSGGVGGRFEVWKIHSGPPTHL